MPKGNPNPSPATCFSADNPGRAKQKGARDRLTADFLEAMADDFETHGREAIERVRTEDPAAYLRIVAALVPKDVELRRDSLDELSTDQLADYIEALRAALDPVPEGADPGS